MYQAIASIGNILLKLGEFGTEYESASPIEIPDDSIVNSSESENPKLSDNTSESPSLPEGVTTSSELTSSALLKEALADAAQSSESSLSSPVRSTSGDDYVMIPSEDGFSSPEQIDPEQNGVVDSLSSLYVKLENTRIDAQNVSSTGDDNGDEATTPTQEEPEMDFDSDLSERRSGMFDSDWSISFEQFLASMLTEPYIVHYFEQQIDVIERLKRLKTEGLTSFKSTNNLLEGE